MRFPNGFSLQSVAIGLLAIAVANHAEVLSSHANPTPIGDRAIAERSDEGEDFSDLARAICGDDNFSSVAGNGAIALCEICPSFTSDGRSNGGGQPEEFSPARAALTAVTYGRFTTGNDSEAIVDVSGCEGGASNFGGSILLRENSPGRWEILRYKSGYRSHSCISATTATGPDLLLCEAAYTGMGYRMNWLEMRQFSDRRTESQQLLGVQSNLHACRPPFVDVEIVGFELHDENGDDWQDLVVSVRSAVSEEMTVDREAGGFDCDRDFILSEPIFDRLVFYFDGTAFWPASESAERIAELEALGY